MLELMLYGAKVKSAEIDYSWTEACTVRYNAALPSQYSMSVTVYGCDLRVYDQTGILRGTVSGNDQSIGVTASVTIPAGTSSLRFETKLLDSLPETYELLGLNIKCDSVPAASWISSISDWDKAKVRRLFFTNAGKLTSVPDKLSPNFEYIRFELASILNDPNISKWDTSNLKSMRYMFNGCSQFNQPVNSWNTSNVTNMSSAFSSCPKFNQTIANWDVSNVTDLSYMFSNSSTYNQNLSSMIFKSTANRTNYDNGTVAWLTQNKPKFTGV